MDLGKTSCNLSVSFPRRRESIASIWNKRTFQWIPAFAGMTLRGGKIDTFNENWYFLNSRLRQDDKRELTLFSTLNDRGNPCFL
jgi:hypothetical protein